MYTLGKHILVDFYGCPPELLNDIAKLEDIFLAAVSESGATYLEHHIRPFKPQGVTGVIIVAESHLAFHTWPECEYVAIDYFTCGNRVNPDKAIDFLTEALSPKGIDWMSKNRGSLVISNFKQLAFFDQPI